MTQELLGPYRLLREVGLGGMGRVYESEDTRTGGRVALKRLHPGRAESPRVRERFRREAAALSKVRHPALVSVLDCDLDAPEPFLVMPFIDGFTLESLVRGLKEGRPDVLGFLATMDGFPPGPSEPLRAASTSWVRFVVRVGADVADALAAAHDAALVHRDLKPANIMVAKNGSVHLLDFGLVFDAKAVAFTRSDERLGTPLYMSPEHLEGARAVDHRSDLWSLGASLSEALTLELPFETRGRAFDPGFRRIPRVPSAANPAVSGGLDGIVLCSLRCDPRDRYQHASLVALDLKSILDGGAPSRIPVVPLRRRGSRKAAAAVAITVLLASVLLVALLAANSRSKAIGGLGESLAASECELENGEPAMAFDGFLRILGAHPAEPRARAGLERSTSLLLDRSKERERTFRYTAASHDLQLVARVDPEGGALERAALFLDPSYRRLEALAVALSDRSSPVEERSRLVASLADEELHEVPPGERDRLLLAIAAGDHAPQIAAPDPGVVVAAFDALAQLRIGEAADLAMKRIADAGEDRGIRIAAVQLNGKLRHAPSRRLLEERVHDGGGLGAAAIRALGEIGDVRSVPPLLSIVESREGDDGALAAVALCSVDVSRLTESDAAEASRRLVAAYASAKAVGVQLSLLKALGRIPGDGGTEFFLRILASEGADALRATAARWLGPRAIEVGEDALIRALVSDRSRAVRGTAALSLRLATPRIEAALLGAAANDPSGEVRARALLALGRSRVVAALRPALAAFEATDDPVVRRATLLLIGLLQEPDPDAVALLARLLRTDGVADEERRAAAWSLGRLRDPAVLSAITDLLRDEVAHLLRRGWPPEKLDRAGSALLLLLADPEEGVASILNLIPALVDFRMASSVAEATVIGLERQLSGASREGFKSAAEALVLAAGEGLPVRLRVLAITALGRTRVAPELVIPALDALWRKEGRRDVRRVLALTLARHGEYLAASAILDVPSPGGEDALIRGLLLLRLGRPSEAREPLLVAARAGILDRSRLDREPELLPVRALVAGWFSLIGLGDLAHGVH